MRKKSTIWGYARISTMKQSIKRQVENIKGAFPDAVVVSEAYTGTTLDRPAWGKLRKQLKAGDVVVFDEVSRMSRNAEEGFALYQELFEDGIDLVFLKEPQINTRVFRETAQLALTGNDIADVYIEATNKVLMMLARRQIEIAFETAQHEVDFLHQRTSEGVRRAQAEGKQVGRAQGTKVETRKAKAAKEIILKHSKAFSGTLGDAEVMKLTGLARNTYYKYKAELKETA